MPLVIHLLFLCLDVLIVDVVIIAHQLVDSALWSELDDAVGHGVDELMVVRCKQNVTLKLNQVVVECLNRLQIQVVGWGVEDKSVSILKLHTSNHTAHLLTSREYVNVLQHILLLEEHTTKERLHCYLVTWSPL